MADGSTHAPQVMGAQKAVTDHYLAVQWAASKLPVGVANRLLTVDRCISAIGVIVELLDKDARGKMDESEESDVQYGGFQPIEVEGLRNALTELVQSSAAAIEEIRDNDHGCVDRQ